MSGFNDVVTREASWYTTDPCPTFTNAPPQLLHRTRSVTDGQVFASSNVASSVTANFTSADIGSTIAASAFASTATIAVVTNASSVIMSASSSSTASSTDNAFTIDNGAPFDLVQGYMTKVPARQRALYITCEGIRNDELDEFQAHREVVYPILLTVYWSFGVGTGQLEDEQQNLHNAINSILLRTRGPLTDKTHNAQFVAAAAGGPEGDGRITVNLRNSYEQVTNREPLIAEIRYFVSDWLAGGLS
jgi:hypothetical protein